MNSSFASTLRLAAAEPRPTAIWHVRLLGGFDIDDGRQSLSRLRSRAAMALLARLALAPQRAHAREELAALLWPDASAATGRSRLRQTLSLLKAVLEPPGGPAVLLADRRVLRVASAALWCDAVAFEDALRAGRHEEAEALYRGELLPGLYDEWIEDERARLAALRDRLGDLAATATRSLATPAATPPAPSSPAPATPRLPHYLTRLIGADVSGARLLAAVSAHRLVTVLGAGGCGKTRIAVEVAHHALAVQGSDATPAFDGAVFVSLLGAIDRTDLHDRLLLALRLGGGDDAPELLLQALGGRRMLMLLDNAEQLDDSAASALAALAERAPSTHWLLTSRRPLGLDGEQTFALEALPVPPPDAALDEVAMNPAVALFVDRARAHRADFHVSQALRESLVELVRWLEGLPLALELAASNVRTLGPAELLALLVEARRQPGTGALGYLARRGVRSGTDPRHASMFAVVQWSWRLLDAPQRDMLRALSLAPGGATRPLAAAMAVEPPLPPLPATQTQALLDALVAHSVLRVQAGQDGQPRYTPFAPVREFALAQCDEGAQRSLRRRLLSSLLQWADAMPATPPLPQVRDELPNVTLALEQASADGHADDAARLVLRLQSSWGEIALPGGVLEALNALLQAPGLDDALAAGCHALVGSRCQEAGRPDDARRHMAQAMGRLAACAAPDPAVKVMVLGRVARTGWRLDRDHVRARELIAQALPLARAADRPNSEASLLSLEAHLATVVDRDPARGTALSRQALALWQRSGNRHLVNAGRFNVATNRMKSGQYAEVLDEYADLCSEGRELQDWDLAAGALEARGTALLGLRRWAESAADLRESVRLAWEGMEAMALAYALWNLPPALARLRHGELAAETMGAAEALWRQRFGVLDAADLRDLKRVRRFVRTLLGPDAAHAAWQRGASRRLADVVYQALSPLRP